MMADINTAIYTDGATKQLPDGELSLEFMRKVVDGYIEVVPIGSNLYLVCNEGGKLMKLPPNPTATIICMAFGFYDEIVGNVIICTRDKIK